MCSAYSAYSDADLADTIDQLGALGGAILTEMLRVVAEYDRRGAWADEADSLEGWLAYRRGVSARTGRAWARLARALDDLPAIAEGMACGRLSEDKVRPLCDLATPGTDSAWAERAEEMTPAALARHARRARQVAREEEDEARRTRDLRMWWSHDRGHLRLSGRLPAAAGAALEHAVRLGAERAERDPATRDYAPYGSRCADALAELAWAKLDAEPNRDRATVVVHLDGELVRDAEGDNDVRLRLGAADIQGGPTIGWRTLEELGVNARWQLVARGPDGQAMGIGRVSRQVPFALERELWHRDVTCRWPGCERTVACHAHHITHWEDGGTTDLGNLCLLCPKHHRLLHEEGWRVEGDGYGVLRFIRPDGRELRTTPPRLREDLRGRLLGSGRDAPTSDVGDADLPQSVRGRSPPAA